MTDFFARPADQPADANGEATVPLGPESGYTQPIQQPFSEETLVDPLGFGPQGSTVSPSAHEFGYSPTPGGSVSAGPGQSAQQPPPAGQPNAAAGHGQSYTQPSYAQPYPQPSSGEAPYGSGLPPFQGTGYAEPNGPAGSIPAQAPYQNYQSYAAQGYQQPPPQWPAVINGMAAYDYGYRQQPAASDHPNAIPALVLGIIGLVFFPLVSPVAWFLGASGKRQMQLDPTRWRQSGSLTAGMIMGIIGTAFWGLMIAFFVFIIVISMASG